MLFLQEPVEERTFQILARISQSGRSGPDGLNAIS
jgi:hypothetical protein